MWSRLAPLDASCRQQIPSLLGRLQSFEPRALLPAAHEGNTSESARPRTKLPASKTRRPEHLTPLLSRQLFAPRIKMGAASNWRCVAQDECTGEPHRGEYQHQKSGNRQISDQQESTTCRGTSTLGVYDKREGNYADRYLYLKAGPT